MPVFIGRTIMRKLAPVALVFLAGCSLMPSYQRPAAPVAAQWPQALTTEGGQAVAGLSWRQMLPAPRLQTLIESALEHNRDLRVAVARVEEARAQYGIARADRLPSIDLAASANAIRTPADLSSTGQRLTTRRYDVNLGLAAFELDFWGRVASLSEAAKASYLATEEAQRAFRLSLVTDVATAYFTLLELEERMALARTNVASRAETRRLIDRRRQVGIAGDLDFLAADGAYQSALGDLASLERQSAAAANALTLLAGKPLTEPLAEGTLADQGIVVDLAPGVPSEVLVRRPDVLAAEQKLVAANANIGAARAAFLPRISLTAALGTASKALSGLFDAGSGAWNFQPVLRLPLFDFGRTAANLDLTEARKVIAVAEYEKAIQQAFREVADLLAAREKLAVQLAAQQAGEKSQTERLKIVDARYQAGISSYLEVLDAQRELFAAQQGVVQTRRAWLTAAVQLYKALAVGD
jgi:outer membrane protein, multidrug efflux system